MDWVYIALGAYVLQAIVFAIDSVVVTKHLKNATSYAFFVSLLGLFAVLLAPWGFEMVRQTTLITALFAGTAFTFGTLFFYRALHVHEASRVVPVVGGMVPVFAFALSFIFLPEQLPSTQILSFVILVTGTVLITYPFHRNTKHHMKPAIIGEMLFAALLFACWGTLSKRVFLDTNFINGLIWIRLGAAAGGLLLLFGGRLRKEILHGKRRLKVHSGGLIIGNKMLSAVATIALTYAIAIGNTTLVHALQGVQFVFLFGIVVILSHWFPKFFKEDLRPSLIAQKLGSSILIAAGVAMLLI